MIRKILRHRLSPELQRRPLTRVLDHPWPFLFSVEGGELFKNLPAAPQAAKKSRKSGRRVKIGSPD